MVIDRWDGSWNTTGLLLAKEETAYNLGWVKFYRALLSWGDEIMAVDGVDDLVHGIFGSL